MSEDPGGPAIRPRTQAIVLLAFALAIGTVVFFSGALPGMDPFYENSDPDDNPAVGVAVGLGLGSVYFVLGWSGFRRVQLFLGTPTSKVRSLPVGTVEVKGRARPVDEPLTAPLTGRDACLYELEVEVPSESEGGDSRFTTLEVRRYTPFRLDDGTGQVLVDPRGAHVPLEGDETAVVPPDHLPPEEVVTWIRDRRFEEGKPVHPSTATTPDEVREDLGGRTDERRWIHERVIAPGETTYVWGGARPRDDVSDPDNPRNLVVEEDPGTGVFCVSDKSEGELTERMVLESGVLLAAAFLFLTLGALILLEWFGLG